MSRCVLVAALLAALLAGCAPAAEPTRLVAEPAAPTGASQPTVHQSPTPTTAPSAEGTLEAPSAGADEAYPPPVEAVLHEPYPGARPTMAPEAVAGPTSAPAIAKAVISEPAPGMATVTGQVYYRVDDSTREPLRYARVFLARRLRDAQGQPSFMVSLSQSSAPTTITDGEGVFALGDADPDDYALIVELGSQLVLAHDLQTDRDVVFAAEADQITDIGTILVAPR